MRKAYLLITFLLLSSINLIAQSTVLTGLNGPGDLLINGNDLYFIDKSSIPNSDKIAKIDITDTTPTVTDVITGLSGLSQLILNGNDLYFNLSDKIAKIDITDTTPTVTDVITNSDLPPLGFTLPLGLLLNGNDLYFAWNVDRISKTDITETTPTITDVVTGLEYARDLQLKGNDLYFNNQTSQGNKISKIDITETTPTVIHVIVSDPLNFFSIGEPILINGNNLYFVQDNSNIISKINITDTMPTYINVVTGLNSAPSGLAVNGNDLYISQGSAKKIIKFNFTLSVKENILMTNIKAHPNPSSNFIKISKLSKNENYTIYNALGTKIKKGTTSDKEKIDINHFSNGLYFLKFDSGSTLKFIKK